MRRPATPESLGLVLALAVMGAATTVRAQPVLTPVTIEHVDAVRGRVVVLDDHRGPAPADSRLFLADAQGPIAWMFPVGAVGGFEFGVRAPALLPRAASAVSAWLVPGDLTARLLPYWPARAALTARISAVGPGGRSVWLDAGSDAGLAPQQTFWLRIGGQPVGRFDVVLVERRIAFCRVVPLVDDMRLAAGQRAERWPAPGEERRGEARTAVVFTESAEGRQIVWAPAPRGVAIPAEPRLDLFRDGLYVGHAIVERRDDRFWFARTLPPAEPDSVRVGDIAQVRTQAVIDRRAFPAHITHITGEGFLINAGEADGLAVGDSAEVFRGPRRLGRVQVRKVQTTYAAVALSGDEPAAALQAGDVVRFATRPAPPTPVGALLEITSDQLFLAQSDPNHPIPLQAPLAVRLGGRTIGVAIAVAQRGDACVGFILEHSITQPAETGAQLTFEEQRTP